MTDEQIVSGLVDHAEWMVKSGQFNGTVERYLGFLRYRDEEQKAAVFAEFKRRQSA